MSDRWGERDFGSCEARIHRRLLFPIDIYNHVCGYIYIQYNIYIYILLYYIILYYIILYIRIHTYDFGVPPCLLNQASSITSKRYQRPCPSKNNQSIWLPTTILPYCICLLNLPSSYPVKISSYNPNLHLYTKTYLSEIPIFPCGYGPKLGT